MKKFPYAVYFQVSEEEILVVAIVHGARNPDQVDNLLNRDI